jgi:hypothetical protein
MVVLLHIRLIDCSIFKDQIKFNKAKGRAKLLVVQVDAQQASSSTPSSDNNNHTENEDGFNRTPATPIHVLQRIGRQLGIPEENLTKEKLEAAPKEVTNDKSDNV